MMRPSSSVSTTEAVSTRFSTAMVFRLYGPSSILCPVLILCKSVTIPSTNIGKPQKSVKNSGQANKALPLLLELKCTMHIGTFGNFLFLATTIFD